MCENVCARVYPKKKMWRNEGIFYVCTEQALSFSLLVEFAREFEKRGESIICTIVYAILLSDLFYHVWDIEFAHNYLNGLIKYFCFNIGF